MYYMYVYTHIHTYIHIYGFLVCRYARSPGLAAPQNTPALDVAIYRPIGTSYQLQPSFHPHSTEPDNSRVYVRFLPFVSGRVHLGRVYNNLSILGSPLEPRESAFPHPRVHVKTSSEPKPASISDATTQMDHSAVVLFTIDRLARSPRTTVRRRSPRKAPDR